MAGKKADKKADAPKKSGGGIMGILSKVFGILAILSAAMLFAGAFDVGHMGLHGMLSSLAAVPLAIFTLCSIAGLFLGGKKPGSGDLDGEALTASVSEFQAKTISRFASIQESIDAMSGRDYEALVEENKALQAQLDEINEAERNKAEGEMEQLRLKNEALEEQIKQWAIQSVGAAVAGETLEEMEAA